MNNPNKKYQHRWSTTQCTELLEAIVDKLKDNPEGFEKPTAYKFYTKLFELYTLPDIATLGILLVKNKLRNLKTNFIKAEEWKAQTGAGLLEEGKEKTVKDYINKKCPHYDLLEEIFGQRKIINLPPIYDSSKEIEVLESDSDNSTFVDVSNLEIVVADDDTSSHIPSAEVLSPSRPSTKRLVKSCSKKPANSSLQYLTSLQENRKELDQLKLSQQIKSDNEKLKFEKMKWHMECEFKTKSLDIEREKVELEKLKVEGELALRKLQLEKDFELKKFELELKYRK